jgi:predicted acylesterase/phospholipase RssA/CRP-like cAMP-binding protein
VSSLDRSLASVGIFRNLDPVILRRLEAELQWLTLEAGDTLVRQGEAGDSLFILMSGRLGVFVEGADGEDIIGEIGKGDVVGEVAFIADLPYSATVLALRASVLARLTRASLQQIQSEHPTLTGHVMRMLAARLHAPASRSGRVDRGSTIALVVASDDPHVRDVCAQFVPSLAQYGRTLHLDRDRVAAEPTLTGAGPDSDFAFTEWLARCEAGARFVVCETDARPSTWTERSLHHADRVLLFVRADGTDTPESVARQLRALGVDQCLTRRELVLVRTRSANPPDTMAWRGMLPLSEIYHVRSGEGADVERLARIIAGRAVGLVLGGGGARGLAHIGVVRALREAGIPIDYVGGASMGAVVAGEVALGWPSDMMLRRSKEEFRINPVRGDYTLPLVAVSTAKKLLKMLTGLFGDARIEDQIVGYFCVSCNLTRGEIVVHREGQFRECTRASSALPGFWPPVFRNGELLVDGSIMNNTPGDVMKTICGGRVIVVDVSPRRELRAEISDRYVLSGWEALRHRPRAGSQTSHPNIFNIVMRAAMLNSVLDAEVMRRQVDLYLQPPVTHVDMFNWGAIESTAEIGYRYTMEQIEAGRFATDAGA